MPSFLLRNIAVGFALLPMFSSGRFDSVRQPALFEQLCAAKTPTSLEQYSHTAVSTLGGGSLDTFEVDLLAERIIKGQALGNPAQQVHILERDVVKSFNYLMMACIARCNQTDSASVHALRQTLRTLSPEFQSLSSMQEVIEPTEAVYLLILLITNNGSANQRIAVATDGSGAGPQMNVKNTIAGSSTISMLLALRKMPAKKRKQLFSRTLALINL